MIYCFWWLQVSAIDTENVVILVNSTDQESIDLGYYYALKRNVPTQNIIQLPLPAEEKISWESYLDSLYNPLVTQLLAAGWLEGFSSRRKDPLGRVVSLIESHRIEALVICKGVPLRILNDPARLPAGETYPKGKKQFYTNRAAVDSELALLPFPKANVDAFYPNSLYRRTKPRNLFDMKPLVVGRLDGPSYELARALVDRAITAEEDGIAGRAYVDMSGPHEQGDEWLESVVETLEENGFDVAVHREKGQFNLVDRFDEPLFYFGWYSGGIDGPFTQYGFKFPVGAIALHIHSFSASSIRTSSKHWVGPLIARGVTATFGNTSEPFLFLTHQPQYFVEGLFKGLTTGEAALFCVPALSWVGIFIGDPLYLPPLGFKLLPKNEYDVLRTANKARRAGDASAYKAVVSEHSRSGHFATGLWLHRYFLARNDPDSAYEYLQSTYRPSLDDSKNWGILVEISEAYFELDYKKEAEGILDGLLKFTRSKREVQLQLLDKSIQLATYYGLLEKADIWQKRLNELTAPAEEKANKN
ncbi:MAG: TIGR03790 family protein [Verrucomicrobia bacterium]|nr:TIGR03790 family protein [Verrucomicrobiota bacterium]